VIGSIWQRIEWRGEGRSPASPGTGWGAEERRARRWGEKGKERRSNCRKIQPCRAQEEKVSKQPPLCERRTARMAVLVVRARKRKGRQHVSPSTGGKWRIRMRGGLQIKAGRKIPSLQELQEEE
jgi:hypothetical protein